MATAIHPFLFFKTTTHLAHPFFHWKPFKVSTTSCTCKLKRSPSVSADSNTSVLGELMLLLTKESDCLKAFTILQREITQNGYTPHPSVCELLIDRLSHSRHLEQMRCVLSLMSEPTENAFCLVMLGYAKAHMVEQALGVLNEMKVAEVPPTIRIYNIYLDFLVRESKFTMVESLFSQMRSSGIQPNVETIAIMIKGQCMAGNMASASSLLDHMWSDFGLVPDEATYNTIIAGSLKMDSMEALESLKKMESNGWSPNVVDNTMLINGFYEKSKMDEAIKLLEKMYRSGIYPGPKTFTIFIHEFCQQGRMKEAIKILEEMRGSGPYPNTVTYTALINGFCKQLRMEEAMIFLDEMRGSGLCPDAVTFILLINGFCKQGRVENAIELLQPMFESGLYPDTRIFNLLISGFCKQGRMKNAVKLLEEMCGSGLHPNIDTMNTLINGFCRKRSIDEAVKLLDDMCGSGLYPNVKTFTTLIIGFCNLGRKEEAFKILEELCRNGPYPSTVINAVISGLCRSRDKYKATLMLKKIVGKGMKPDAVTCNYVIQGLCMMGSSKEARKLLDKMAVKGCGPDIYSYNCVLRAMNREGRTETFIELFNELTSKGYIPDDYTYSIIFFFFIKNDLNAPLKFTYQMLARGCIPDGKTYYVLVKRLLREGKSHQATQLMNELEAKGFYSRSPSHFEISFSRNR